MWVCIKLMDALLWVYLLIVRIASWGWRSHNNRSAEVASLWPPST